MTDARLPAETRAVSIHGRLNVAIVAVCTVLGLVSVAPASARGTTRIVVRIDCPGCVIRAINAVDYASSGGSADVYFTDAVVRRGKAVLTVPTTKTAGLAFEVEDIPYDLQGGIPTVALSRKGGKGSWCWTGTSRKRVVMHFSTSRWTDRSVPATAPGRYNLAVWASPEVRAWTDQRNLHRLSRGGLSQQNQPSCESN